MDIMALSLYVWPGIVPVPIVYRTVVAVPVPDRNVLPP